MAPDTKIEHTYEFLKLIQYNSVISIAYENLDLVDKKLLSFAEEKHFEVDFSVNSFYCETHPDSKFNKVPIIAIKSPSGRKTINDREFKIFEGNNIIHIEENITDERFNELLVKEFNIKNYRRKLV